MSSCVAKGTSPVPSLLSTLPTMNPDPPSPSSPSLSSSSLLFSSPLTASHTSPEHVTDAPPSYDSIPSLPHFPDMADPVFVWGSFDGPTCASNITACYEEAVHWKPNLFCLPSGRVGETFVAELSRLFNGYATASALESVALKAAHLLPILVLQKTSKKLKNKAITSHIDRRLTLWQDGCFLDLLREGRNI